MVAARGGAREAEVSSTGTRGLVQACNVPETGSGAEGRWARSGADLACGSGEETAQCAISAAGARISAEIGRSRGRDFSLGEEEAT